MLKRNFDKRDDWSNIKPHCHALNEHDEGLMVLPEFRLNHKYYSTHALFKNFEPIRRSELFKYDEDKDFDKPCKARKAYDQISMMLEKAYRTGRVVSQDDILKVAKKYDKELYESLLKGEVEILADPEED